MTIAEHFTREHDELANATGRMSADYWSISQGLRLVGDRWSLLIVRELLGGEMGFNDMSRALPDISRTLLSQRLKRLVQLELVIRNDEAGPRGSRRYRLTPSGYGLRQTLESLGLWASQWQAPFENDLRAGLGNLLEHMGRSLVTDSLPRKSIVLAFEFDNVRGAPFQGLICRENNKTTSSIGRSERIPDLQIHVAPRVLYDLWWGLRRCEDARKLGSIGFVGPEEWAAAFSGWFAPRAAS
ncbi:MULTISPECIES: helix-turn-helix domain-containing protein [Arthrobacter]|uniref:winged helix-turn-helix transcriptional regulator n=1 Tax=Arthrobacter TaxID=1663 RepID=UPI00254C70CC|nr:MULTISPECIES: helix-turn-helix domain-containing protein [Arthrobacter]MDQ0212169.1 DNA-binding HxlR family transcriptional regulator [Arthrobacter bambusae]MDQ0236612.1 DNA-binding HxlR family transcriptional regulator [Arthrobacter bambusae]